MTSLSGDSAQALAHGRLALTSLPTEIISKIIDNVPFESHLDVTLTCRRLAECARGVLRRHRGAHEKYRIASDRDPATVLTLLRSVFGFGDPIPAWHVRSFESWDLRRLKAYDGFPQSPHDGLYRYTDGLAWEWHADEVDADGFAWEWHAGEVDAYVQVFDDAGFPADLLEDLRAEMRGQRDAALKFVLFATLPRLRDIKLARSTPTSGDMESPIPTVPHEPYAWLSWLQKAIEKGIHLAPQARGLQALESLAIGVKTGDEDDDELQLGHLASPKLFAQLLRLPRLSSLYLHRLSEMEGDEDLENYSEWRYMSDGIYNPAPGSSVLEHLYLDGAVSICRGDYFNTLMAAPKALRTVALRSDSFGDVANIGDHATCFFERQPESIESIMVYNPGNFRSYRSRLYFDQDLSRNPARQFTLDMDDIFNSVDEKTLAAFVEYLDNILPWNLEVLVLLGPDGGASDEFEGTDDVLADAIFSLLRTPNEHGLKTLYLCNFERPGDYRVADSDDDEVKNQVRFQKAITMGIKMGVDVVTRTTRRQDLINGEPIFPRAVDKYDLMTGPFGGQRPPADQGRLFDPVTGTHPVHLCDHCGECEECLAIYPRELWEKTREQRAWARAREWHDWTEPEWFAEGEGEYSDEDGEGEDGENGQDDGISDDLDMDDEGGHNIKP
ncbi:hypothetical protein F5X68DRAFT_218297 [Plectosphaerella plurivora]|uniref:F-box domain-containing protein n=1 Tax=Plectosphaerella plurivora TaxID=936078 RepID=A0A9P8V1B4_9PEZI|nr:hypothetical protein F5X68DRAFT_218297 [Plectosphaerella plurivora]